MKRHYHMATDMATTTGIDRWDGDLEFTVIAMTPLVEAIWA